MKNRYTPAYPIFLYKSGVLGGILSGISRTCFPVIRKKHAGRTACIFIPLTLSTKLFSLVFTRTLNDVIKNVFIVSIYIFIIDVQEKQGIKP